MHAVKVGVEGIGRDGWKGRGRAGRGVAGLGVWGVPCGYGTGNLREVINCTRTLSVPVG